MNVRNPFVQTVILIGIALVFAIVGNGFASRTRRLVLPGNYPNATKVPQPAPPSVTVPIVVAQPTATTATAPQTAATSTVAETTTAATTTGAATAVPPPTAIGINPAAKDPNAPAPAAVPAPKAAGDPLARFAPHPDKAYIEIGGDDVALLYANGALVLDARRTSVYEDGHIAGARSFPVWEADVDERVNALFAERGEPAEQNKPIVIYCSGGACEDSHMLAQKLWNIQFNNVYVYKDGFPDWQKRGGAVRTGAQP